MTKKNVRVTQMSHAEAKKHIRKLTVENRRLIREIDDLKREIDELNGKGSRWQKRGKYQSALKRRADYEDMFSKKNFFAFAFSHLKHTSFFSVYKKMISIIRRYTFLTVTLKIASILFLFVETAALFVISTSAFFFSIIVTFITSYIFAFLTIFVRHKSNRENIEILKDKNVTIFFPPKERAFDIDSYLAGFAKSIAEDKNSVVVIVSPFTVKNCGLNGSRKKYFASRLDGENILIVRRYYYFTLRNKIIEKYSSHITEIY